MRARENGLYGALFPERLPQVIERDGADLLQALGRDAVEGVVGGVPVRDSRNR